MNYTFVQDYSDAATVHGVSYIFQRDQTAPHRLLWLLIVSMGVFGIRMRMLIFVLMIAVVTNNYSGEDIKNKNLAAVDNDDFGE